MLVCHLLSFLRLLLNFSSTKASVYCALPIYMSLFTVFCFFNESEFFEV